MSAPAARFEAVPLLRSQRAWVFSVLTNHGFDPREFDLQDEFSTVAGPHQTILAPALVHRATRFYFAFRIHPEQPTAFWVEFSPGNETQVDSYGSGDWGTVVAPTFQEWLRYVRREIEAPDLWGALRGEAQLVAGDVGPEAENTPFTRHEQTEIRRQLEEIKQLVRANHSLNETQLAALDSRLDFLAEATSRLGRIDWREAFVGSMLGLVLQAIVPVEPIREVLIIVGRALGHLFGGDLPELPPG